MKSPSKRRSHPRSALSGKPLAQQKVEGGRRAYRGNNKEKEATRNTSRLAVLSFRDLRNGKITPQGKKKKEVAVALQTHSIRSRRGGYGWEH